MSMNNRPEFIDNTNGNTLAEGLNTHLSWLRDTHNNPSELSIATGYFNPGAYALLSEELNQLNGIRLLLGADPTPSYTLPPRPPGDSRFDSNMVNKALSDWAQGLENDRNLIGFTLQEDQNAQDLIRFLKTGKIEVRQYQKAFLHGKAFIFNENEGFIAGSSNFTTAGLTTNMELDLGRYDPTPVAVVKNWFDNLWEESVPFDLASIYESRYAEYDPYLIYLRVLWELYQNELEAEAENSGRIPLTTFQNDGISRAKIILEKYNGALIADGVGLGKTFIGGELIRQAVENQRQRALLICPAALRDGTWARWISNYQVYVECRSYEEFMAGQLGADINDYSIVVIDEAQAFRNPGTNRAAALRRLLQVKPGTPPKKLVLMSATPVNNSLWDLYNMLSYFIKQDAAFSNSKGIISMQDKFKEAQAQDPADLSPDALFDILDEVTVRRTRSFIKKYYTNETTTGSDGVEITIKFPTPHVNRIDYDLETMMPDLLDDFERNVMPESGVPALSLARYCPEEYRLEKDTIGEPSMIGLLRSALLKRLESSPYAFANTLRRMIADHQTFLEALEEGWVLTTEEIHEFQATDNDEELEDLIEYIDNPEEASIKGFHSDKLAEAVRIDMGILTDFLARSETILRDQDTKLQALVEALKKISQKASEDGGLNAKDTRDNRKVIIFSYFADTVEWIEKYLIDVIDTDPALMDYKNRLVSVTGSTADNRQKAVFGFAPISSEAPPGQAEDLYDILVTTDTLSEGQNLQQCRNIINYDLPWNPMRLVQRHGRIDRIASTHENVYMGCIFPDVELERLLVLEARIRNKLQQAAATIGVESAVIPDSAVADVVFTETLEEIEALRREETDLFENSGAYSGEEYRQELRHGLEKNGEFLKRLPWGVGSGFVSGNAEGHFFCSKIGDRVYLRFVHSNTNEITSNRLQCLKFIDCENDTERYLPESLQMSAYHAWEIARQSIHDEWQLLTDPINIQPRIRPLFLQIAEHLRTYPPRDVQQNQLDIILSSIEAPYPRRIESILRIVMKEPHQTPHEKSDALCSKILELSLQPYDTPEPLQPIEKEEITLICWLAVSKKS